MIQGHFDLLATIPDVGADQCPAWRRGWRICHHAMKSFLKIILHKRTKPFSEQLDALIQKTGKTFEISQFIGDFRHSACQTCHAGWQHFAFGDLLLFCKFHWCVCRAQHRLTFVQTASHCVRRHVKVVATSTAAHIGSVAIMRPDFAAFWALNKLLHHGSRTSQIRRLFWCAVCRIYRRWNITRLHWSSPPFWFA